MPYALLDLELTEPLPSVQLEDDETGLAIVSRQGGYVVGFSMHEARAGSYVRPEELHAFLDPNPVDPPVLDVTATDRPAITVAICSHDRADLLRECVTALLALIAGPEEILVVDNAPSDHRTRDLADCRADGALSQHRITRKRPC
jgi:hypothetical protein